MKQEDVILVNENDEVVGYMGKTEAHQKGILHRAFSIFIFNKTGEMLLQQRAKTKYHSGGLWTNTCCSHPLPGENALDAATRRLKEEMGFETPLEKIFHFIYQSGFENGLSEHEFDHVFTGEYNGAVDFNLEEVSDFCFMNMHEIKELLQTKPGRFTTWFHIAFPKIEEWWQKQYKITGQDPSA